MNSADVVYRSPWNHRGGAVAIGMLATLLLGGALAAIYWALLVPNLWGTSPPTGAHVLGGALLLPLPVIMLLVQNLEEPSRLIVRDDSIWLGGVLAGRTIRYDEVSLLELERPDGTVGKAHKLIVRGRTRRSRSIWLRTADAQEAFDALRTLCEHAPAIGDQQEAYDPRNAHFAQQGRSALAREFRRKARKSLAGTLGCGCLAILSVSLLVFGGPAARRQPKAWIGAVLLPLAAVGCAVAWSQNRSKADQLADR